MSWQDFFFAGSGLGYTLALLPSCFDSNTEIPRKTSLPMAAIMAASAFVWGTLGMALSSTVALAGALPWLWLAWRRPSR